MIERIGRYEVQAELGRGGFGQVFRAYDPTVGRQVAIKTLTTSDEPDLLTRFRNEAAAAGKLRHPNIVVIYDFGEQNGTPYLVMELVDGEDLERLISRQRPLTLLQSIDVMRQVASGLHHAHTKGIVHRDVKPANIMRTGDGTVKIMDFGIALLTQATAARITLEGSLIGTVAYMAPEQLQGKPADTLTDIFAYGITCYRLLTGTHPFLAATLGQITYNIIAKTPAPIRTLSPQCPEALEELVLRTLEKDREARYQSLEDVQFDLEPIIRNLRRERVRELLDDATSLLASDQLQAAQAAVREVLEVDPGNRSARELRERVQLLLKESIVRPRIVALVNEGREQLGARQFDQAIQKFESALRLEKSNAELHALLNQARALLDAAHRADRLVGQAREALNRDDLTAAGKNLADAIAADPRHAEAEALLADVQDRLKARQREQRLKEGLSEIKRLMLLQGFDQAVEALQMLQEDYPESAEAAQLLLRAKSEQEVQARRQRLQDGTDTAKELLRHGKLSEALEHLSQLQSEFPESAELRDLRAYAEEELRAQKQAEAIRVVTEQVRGLMEARDFDAALETLRHVLAQYPAAPALRDLMQSVAGAQAEHQRKKALEDVVRQSSELIAQLSFTEALERIDAFVRAFGDNSTVEPIRRQAEEGLGRQRREAAIRKVLLEGQTLLEAGRSETATQVLHQGSLQFPGQSDITQLLEVAQNRLRDQRESEAVSQMITEAESLTRARQFDQALEILDDGLRQYPGAERLLRCRQATVATRQADERERARRETLDHARRLLADRKFDEALRFIDKALEGGQDPALLELRKRTEAEQKASEVKALVEQARQLLDRGNVLSATQMLQAGKLRFPDEAAVTQLFAVADKRLQDQKRSEEITSLVRSAEEQIRTKLFQPALEQLEAGLRKYGPEAPIAQARQAALAAKAAEEREQSISQALDTVNRLRSAGKLKEALQALGPILERFNDDVRVVALKQQIEAEQEAQRRAEEERRQAIEAIVRNAARLVETGQFAQAIESLDQGLRRYPGSDALTRARDSAAAARTRAELLAEVRRVLVQGEFEHAHKIIEEGLRRSPADRELQALKIRVAEDWEKHRRSQAIDQALKRARDLLNSGQAEAAVNALGETAAKYPGEAGVSALLRDAEKAVQKQREQALQDLRSQTESLLVNGRQQEAIALLTSRLPGDPRVQDLLARARTELDERKREELLTEARQLAERLQFSEALAVVAKAISDYGSTPGAIDLRRSLQSGLEEQQRRTARDRGRDQLLDLEKKISTANKAKLKRLAAQALQLAAPHSRDAEIAAIGARIAEQVQAIQSAPAAPRKPLPWRWIATGATVSALIGAGLIFGPGLLRKTPPKVAPVSTIPIEIRTDPLGADVRLGDQSCTTPNCHFDLKPGEYQVEARLQGYVPSQKPLTVDPAKPMPGAVILTLQPEPPPPPQVGAEPAKTGMLIVLAAVPEALVKIDNVPRGRTDGKGELRLPLEAKTYEVSVEKSGYQTLQPQRVKIAEDRNKVITFKLAEETGKVEVSKGPTAGERTIPPPTAPVVPPPVAATSPGKPPSISPEAIEAQDWEQAQKSSDPAQLEAFLTKYPNGPHTQEASSRLEQLSWSKTNKNDPQSLRQYISRFPRGANSLNAEDLLWNGVDKKDERALRTFISQNPTRSYREAAQAALDQLLKQTQAAEQEKQSIREVIEGFNTAFQHKKLKELKQVWPKAPRLYTESIEARGSFAALHPTGPIDIKGDTASVNCDLITKNTVGVTVLLSKASGRWLIDGFR